MRAPNHLNALRAFESAARHMSYVRAAEELNVSPAAVGQLVRGLEESYGVILFHRSRGGPARLVLTDHALAALSDLQTGFDYLSAAVERLKDVGGATVTVTVPPAFADKWLLSRIENFRALHPNYELRLDTNGKLVDFNVERVDLGIRFGTGHWQGLCSTQLMGEEFFPVCSPTLPTATQPLKNAEDLKQFPLIHDVSMRNATAFPTWRTWLQREENDFSDAERGLQINDSAGVIQAAISGAGVALGRRSLVSADLAAGRLIRPFGEAQSCDYAYYLVQKEGVEIEPSANAFKHWLLDQVR